MMTNSYYIEQHNNICQRALKEKKIHAASVAPGNLFSQVNSLWHSDGGKIETTSTDAIGLDHDRIMILEIFSYLNVMQITAHRFVFNYFCNILISCNIAYL
jgi:hypothetical protein